MSHSERDMLFISHASEDNEFTQWLSLQLAKEGYGVWCDLTKLLGGEDWPNEINRALQTRTQKFIFVLSKYSNEKHDP
jgi:proline dehydrogenase